MEVWEAASYLLKILLALVGSPGDGSQHEFEGANSDVRVSWVSLHVAISATS